MPGVTAVLALSVAGVLGFGTKLLVAEEGATDRAADRVQALASIRSEIARLEERFASLSAQESSLEGRLARTEAELSLQEQRLTEATTERDWADQQVIESAERLEELEVQLAAERQDLARRLDGLYRLGRGGYLRLALAVEPGAANQPSTTLLPAMRQLRFLARRDRTALDAFRATRDRVTTERNLQEARRQEAAAWQAEEAARQEALTRLRREQASLLAQVARERRTVASRTATLEEKARKLATLIGALVDDSRTPLDGRPMGGFRGVLDWPIRGRVQVPFGLRRDPRYKTEIPHNGIEIATRVGDDVRTVYPGRVLYAAPFEGFGETVVVHHPGQIYSLYAGLGAVRVGKDDVLLSEAVIGSAAEALYFEIRQKNQPVDPIAWLR